VGISDRQRGIIAIFDDGDDVRRAIADVRRGRDAAGEITLLGGPEALRRCGLLPALAAGGRMDELDRALDRGALLMVVPVADPTAEKRISLALLKHSHDPVQIREMLTSLRKDEEDEPETDPSGARP
jgi:hypothetical protein